MGKQKIMDKTINFRMNNDTYKKMKELVKEYPALYPSDSQVIRSGIHKLHNEVMRDKRIKNKGAII